MLDNSPPTIVGLSDQYRWMLNPAEIVIPLEITDNDDPLSSLVLQTAVAGSAGVAGSWIDNAYNLHLPFTTGVSGIANVTVRATDPAGGFAETDFDVNSVDAVFSDPSVSWRVADNWYELVPDDEVLWADEDHRWNTEIELSLPVGVTSVQWMMRPWDQWEADPTFDLDCFDGEWTPYASVASIAEPAFGLPPLGLWAITAKVNFASTFALMTTVLARHVNRIVETKWVKGDATQKFDGDGLTAARVFPEHDKPSSMVTSVLHDRLKIEVSLDAPIPPGNFRGVVSF